MIALLLMLASPVAAQSDAVLLARTCVSERSWAVETAACAAIGAVVRDRMERRGVSFRAALVALAPRLHGCTIDRRRWLCDLDEDAHRPEGWPRSASWERRRSDWLATLDEAVLIVTGELPSPCAEGTARAWGSTEDLERRRSRGYRWVPATCGDARFANHFGRLFRPLETDSE